MPAPQTLFQPRLFATLTLAALAAVSMSCRPAPPPNIILVVIDTLRMDHVSPLGNRASTPFLEELARKGTAFTRAYSHAVLTGPSHVSMFTGRTPLQHGVRNNAVKLPEDLELLPSKMAAAGYSTHGIVSLGVLRSSFGFSQGFETFDDSLPDQWFRNAESINRSLEALLAEPVREPAFLWLHYSDPHEPYSAPDQHYEELLVETAGEQRVLQINGIRQTADVVLQAGPNTVRLTARGPWTARDIKITPAVLQAQLGGGWGAAEGEVPGRRQRSDAESTIKIVNDTGSELAATLRFSPWEQLSADERRARYREEVEYVDRQLREAFSTLEEAGLLENSVVVITSDHGEELGEKGAFGHAQRLRETAIRVPLLLIDTRIKSPTSKTVDELVRHVDLYSTLLGAAGVDVDVDGLLDLLECSEDNCRGRQAALASAYRPLARVESHSLVAGSRKALFHPARDSLQSLTVNLEAPGEEVVQPDAAHRRLLQVLKDLVTADAGPDDPGIDPQHRQMLESLGYVQ